MAKSLGLQTVAEGVETPVQAEFLARLGCDLGQGYLYSQPLPQAEFDALLVGAATQRHSVEAAKLRR